MSGQREAISYGPHGPRLGASQVVAKTISVPDAVAVRSAGRRSKPRTTVTRARARRASPRGPCTPPPVVLHVDDEAVAQAEDLAPCEPMTLGVGPGVGDGHLAIVLPHVLEMEVVIAGMLAPVDLPLEDLTGLGGPVSGRSAAPEAPARPAAPPLHVRVHERDERLHVARTERFVGLANPFHRSNFRTHCHGAGSARNGQAGDRGPVRSGTPARSFGPARMVR